MQTTYVVIVHERDTYAARRAINTHLGDIERGGGVIRDITCAGSTATHSEYGELIESWYAWTIIYTADRELV